MVKWDLLVIGGGYWGSAIAFEAKRRGWKTLVLDDGDPLAGSRAASGICDPNAYHSSVFRKYWPSDWTLEDMRESLNWLADRGAVLTQEWFWNRFAGTAPRPGAKCLYLPDVATLTQLAGEVSNRSWERISYRRLAIAAGYRTDEVLQKLGIPRVGVGRLYGRGLLVKGVCSGPTPISVMTRPYLKHTVRAWTGGKWKVGDTAEEIPSLKKLNSLRGVGKAVLRDYTEEQISEGYRPVTPQYLVEKVAPGIVVATGGHRLGLGLAGLVAKKVLEAFQ